jgi:hypothetical protein
VGVGYQASALQLITYLVVDENAPYTTEPPPRAPPLLPGTRYMKDPPRFRSPAIADIISWRVKLAIKYAEQLGELLFWDEESDFRRAEDAAVSGDVLLRYVAAVAERRRDVETISELN